jgi:hypothetical protein
MQEWLSGTRGTITMILTWTLGWGVGYGGLIEAFVDPHGELVDIWPAAMAAPGLIGGITMSALLRVTHGRTSLGEVPLGRFAVWGVITGVVLGVLAVASGLSSDIAIDTAQRRPVPPEVMIGITTALGAVAGLGSAVFFRLIARDRAPAVAGPRS